MHIAFLTPEYPHEKTNQSAGLGSSMKNLAIGLVENGHKVSVFVYGQNKTEIIKVNNITIYKIAYKKYKILSWYFYRKDIQKFITSVSEKQKIDLIEAADWTGITAFMKFKFPIHIRLHGSDGYFCNLEGRKQKFKNYFFEKKALLSADYISSVSEFTAKKSSDIFGLKKSITIIYNGIDIEQFLKSTETIEVNTLLYFGTIIRKKGVLELADIFNCIIEKQPEVKLTLLGKNVIDIFENKSTLSLFKSKLSEKALNNVSYISHVPYDKVKTYIAKANVIVLPSFAEAFPMTWLEAMAMEKALVTSNIGWAKELMLNGETGYIEKPTEHQLYADKILELLADTMKAQKFGENARKRIINQFSIEKVVNENMEFYQLIIYEK